MTSDLDFATALAQGAGEILLRLREQLGDDIDGATGDAESNTYLLRELAAQRPDDAVLSEEAADDLRRLDADRVWIIDPLDGTREFTERTPEGGWRPDFAVHVALWTRAAGLTAGVVGLPARNLVHRSDAAPVTFPDTAGRPLRVAVSRTRPPRLVTELGKHLDVELVPMGSAGVKVMSVVTGETDAYIHGGGQYEWDSAAPVAVALGAGLHASRLDGSPLVYNRENPWLPDLLVCHPSKAAELVALLAQIEGNQ
ncbi:MAG: 3'(2'),5'-bisphosphate nucleotidase CysQ [Micropruina sp.]|uniref:3'(2'),5'-bisphosphate nucleotidase CysQ n=1 Tax=Micropruina sp. TaxID=2737536 RepID=UPI0039E401DF